MVVICGIGFILLDYIVHSFTEGIRELGIRFVIAGSASITLGYIYRYHKLLSYIIKQAKNRVGNKDEYKDLR